MVDARIENDIRNFSVVNDEWREYMVGGIEVEDDNMYKLRRMGMSGRVGNEERYNVAVWVLGILLGTCVVRSRKQIDATM